MLDEIHQSFVPGRMPEVLDVLADVGGGLLGVWLFIVLARKHQQP
jgi:VanZ family protein